eukprot:929037-Pelagomonas_calceolata.AAC.2
MLVLIHAVGRLGPESGPLCIGRPQDKPTCARASTTFERIHQLCAFHACMICVQCVESGGPVCGYGQPGSHRYGCLLRWAPAHLVHSSACAAVRQTLSFGLLPSLFVSLAVETFFFYSLH